MSQHFQALKYNTLDVFTTEPFKGNQLGLVHLPSNSTLIQEQKQALAIEFNYSETVILHHPEKYEGVYDAQIFTPKSELPFAGHPTIGTAVFIFQELEKERDEILINLKAGAVKCKYDRETGVASAAIPHDVRVHQKTFSWDRVLEVQTVLEDVKGLEGLKVPVSSIVPGVSFALVDLSAQPELLGKVRVTKDDIATSSDLDEGWQHGLTGDVFYAIVSKPEDDVIRIKQRVMVIELEDPATGAASGALTAYLALQKGGCGKSYKFEIDQGVEMGRASKIFVDVTLDQTGKGIENIELKGQAVEVMQGILKMPY